MDGADPGVIDWLMAGDPMIRWQVQRDLLGAPPSVWQAERQMTLHTGWGARFLAAMSLDGDWPVARWTGAVWTLCDLIDHGLPSEHGPLRASAARFIEAHLTEARSRDRGWLKTRMDLCHLGFWLRIGSHYLGPDPRLARCADFLVETALPDGGFNCRIRNTEVHHGSFHTTFNVLEGLRAAAEAGNLDPAAHRAVEARALDFMLEHRLYRSHRTGAVIDPRFAHLTYPSHWHYTVLRGLEYIRGTPEVGDPRLEDPVAMLAGRQRPNGRWVVERRIPGIEHFTMEPWGRESRWVTLKALRILKDRAAALAAPVRGEAALSPPP